MFNPIDSFEFVQRVALVKKNRPEWQAGKFNGIGGKIELGEAPAYAMAREFEEETGCVTKPEDWFKFCTLMGDGFKVYFYYTFGNHRLLRSVTDEEIVSIPVPEITVDNAIPNLLYLIPMALNRAFERDRASSFTVTEN